jgi:hypothetical protein
VGFAEFVESKIQEAIAEGRFDNLRGAGQPLPPSYFAGSTSEDWLGFKVLDNGGMLPEWLLLGQEVEREREVLDRIDREHANLVAFAVESGAWDAVQGAIDVQRDRFEEQARKLKAKQEHFNREAPGPLSQRPHIWVEYHLDRLHRRVAEARLASANP